MGLMVAYVSKIIAIMCGLCFFGSLNYDQLGVQAVQGAIFITVSENTFHAMYSVVAVFPNDFPIFIRERKSGLYNIVQYYLSNILGMLPGLIVEPLAFVFIFYFLVGFQATWSGFLLTCLVTILVINVATACGYFFSVTFNSVAFGMAYLVPFDYILMTTSGVFVQLASLSGPFRYLKFLSWFMYATESMSIIQWEGVHNISEWNKMGWKCSILITGSVPFSVPCECAIALPEHGPGSVGPLQFRCRSFVQRSDCPGGTLPGLSHARHALPVPPDKVRVLTMIS